MTNDNRTLTDSINYIRAIYKQDPHCLTKHDLDNLETIMRDANWLLGESYRGPMNSPRHHQAFDRIHALLGNLEKKCTDYLYQKKWRDEMLRQVKFNPYHKPAGSSEGGEFDFAPGGGSGGGSGTESPRSPSGNSNTGKPSTTDKLPRPRTPRLPVPTYSNGVKPVSDKDWNTIRDVLDKTPTASAVKKHVYSNVWAAEGGLTKDPSGSAVAGIRQETLDNAKKDPALAAKLKNIKTPNDLKDHPELVPDIYDDYFDENLKEIGGSAGLDAVGNKYAAAAMADTVFREGRPRGAKTLREAISKVDQPIGDLINQSKDTEIVENTLRAYSHLAQGTATVDKLLDETAEARKRAAAADAKKTGKEVPQGELLRADYFRFKKER